MEHGPMQMSGLGRTGFGRRSRRQWSLPAGIIQEVQDILQETSGPAEKQRLGRAGRGLTLPAPVDSQSQIWKEAWGTRGSPQ